VNGVRGILPVPRHMETRMRYRSRDERVCGLFRTAVRHLNAWCELTTDGYTEGAPSR
jgi:hypothetical protein